MLETNTNTDWKLCNSPSPFRQYGGGDGGNSLAEWLFTITFASHCFYGLVIDTQYPDYIPEMLQDSMSNNIWVTLSFIHHCRPTDYTSCIVSWWWIDYHQTAPYLSRLSRRWCVQSEKKINSVIRRSDKRICSVPCIFPTQNGPEQRNIGKVIWNLYTTHHHPHLSVLWPLLQFTLRSKI